MEGAPDGERYGFLDTAPKLLLVPCPLSSTTHNATWMASLAPDMSLTVLTPQQYLSDLPSAATAMFFRQVAMFC